MIVPAGSNIQFSKEDKTTDEYIFRGKEKLDGRLRARWYGEYGHKVIYLDFLTNQSGQNKLPYLNDIYNENKKVIILNSEIPDRINSKLVQKLFSNVPDSFWRYQEGILETSAQIEIDNLKIGGDCDRRYYYATIINAERIKQIKLSFPDEASCGTYMFEDRFVTSSVDGYVNLRSQPNTQGTIIEKLPNNTSVVKIKTEGGGNWFFVQLYQSKKKGYIHKSQLRILD